MTGRVFTFEQASALLPSVRERTRLAMERLESLAEPATSDGAARLESAAEEIFKSWAGELSAMGIEVKGPWLIDFDSGAGYYCWRWPEAALEFFHSYEEGFAGRVRLQ